MNIDFHSSRVLTLSQHACNAAFLSPSFNEAMIVIIHKPWKYRPILLVNLEAKILTKILVMKLGSVILSLVGTDQSGFMPGETTDISFHRLYATLRYDLITWGIE